MRNAGFQTWLALPVARFAMWACFLVYTFFVVWDKASYVDHFGRPLRSTEAWLFGLPVLAVTLGLFELMMRERARIQRPNYFRLMPPDGPRETVRKP
jgi:hypothetical protein